MDRGAWRPQAIRPRHSGDKKQPDAPQVIKPLMFVVMLRRPRFRAQCFPSVISGTCSLQGGDARATFSSMVSAAPRDLEAVRDAAGGDVAAVRRHACPRAQAAGVRHPSLRASRLQHDVVIAAVARVLVGAIQMRRRREGSRRSRRTGG